MAWALCEWCEAPANLIDNYDTLRCWECWYDGGRAKPHNLIIRVLDNLEAAGPTGTTDR